MKRCAWAKNEDMHEYHDKEWCVPVHDDETLFEFITLEGAQAGLSWSTILKRRQGYQNAFANFNVAKVSTFTKKDIDRIVKDPGVIRHRGKIESTVNNAKVFVNVKKEFGSLDTYFWSFVNGKPINNTFKKMSDLPAQTDLSKKLSKDLKKRGCSFVGPTTMYAFMQAVGMVNDHEVSCFRYKEVQQK
jgi:DNA-3-methyladenine glycosylase I